MAAQIEGPWTEAIQSLKDVKSYDTDRIDASTTEEVDNLLGILSPTTASERIRQYVKEAPFEHERKAEGGYTDLAAEKSRQTAEELGSELATLEGMRSELTSNPLRQGAVFGRELAKHLRTEKEYALSLVDELCHTNRHHRDPSVLFGMLTTINEHDVEKWTEILEYVATSDELAYLYPLLLPSGSIEEMHLRRILSLIDSDRSVLGTVPRLSVGRALEGLSADAVSNFVQGLCGRGSDAAWAGLACVFMYCFGKSRAFEQCREALLDCIETTDLSDEAKNDQLAVHHWKETAEWFASNGTAEEVDRIVATILALLDRRQPFGDLHDAVRPVLLSLLNHHFDRTWPGLRDRLTSAAGITRLQYETLLESSDFEGRGESVLDMVPDEELIDWCRQCPDVAPHLVGRVIQVVEDDGEGARLSSTVVRIIDSLENRTDFLDALVANLESGGWTGSRVPRLKQQKAAIQPLTRHHEDEVATWARRFVEAIDGQIRIENQRDDEHELGIFS